LTNHYLLIGGDVSASPSPVMMNTAFEASAIDATYSALSVGHEDLSRTYEAMKAEGVAGGNVTIPYKSAILPLLEESDAVSSRIGAVNSIVRSGSGFAGFNTDVEGIRESLASHGVGSFRKALLIGAGGAARAFCEAATTLGCTFVTVAVRDQARASEFLRDMTVAFPSAQFALRRLDELAGSDADVVFNATPAGSSGSRVHPVVLRTLRRGMVVFDAVYRPVQTELLSAASRAGCQTIAGHEMLLNQAATAFERWTGKRAPREEMKSALFVKLGVR